MLRPSLLVALAVLPAMPLLADPPSASKGQDPPELLPLPGQFTDLYGDVLPAHAIARLGTSRFCQGWFLKTMVFSADGKWLASSSDGEITRLWDVASGKEVVTLGQDDKKVRALAFSPDGKHLVAAGISDKYVYLWKLSDGREIHYLHGHESRISAGCFSRDGKLLATGDQKGIIRLWEIPSGNQLVHFKGSGRQVQALTFSRTGKSLACIDEGGKSSFWDVAVKQPDRRMSSIQGDFSSLAFSPDGKVIALGGNDQAIRLVETQTGRKVWRIDEPLGRVEAVHFSSDGKVLAAVSERLVVRRWDRNSAFLHKEWVVRRCARDTGREISRFQVSKSPWERAAFSPDGATVAMGDYSTVVLRETATGKRVRPITADNSGIMSISFSPDGLSVATTGLDGSVRRWEAKTGREISRFQGHEGEAKRVSFTSDGRTLISGGEDGTTRFWDVAQGRQVRLMDFGIGAISISPDSRFLGAVQEGLQLRDAASGKLIRCFKESENAWRIALSSDGRWIAADNLRYHDGTSQTEMWIRFWDMKSGKPGRRISGSGIAFSPGCSLFAWTDGDIWVSDTLSDRRRGPFRKRFKAKSQSPYVVWTLALSPGGELLVTGGTDGVRLWEVVTGEEICLLEGHRNSVEAVAFSPTGRQVASGSNDGTGLVWDLAGWGQPRNPGLDCLDPAEIWPFLTHDAVVAFPCVAALVRQPDRAVPVLAKHLRPFPAVDSERLRKLVGDLDSDRFAVRKDASNALARMGDLAEPALMKALAGNPSLEKRQRLEALLKPLNKWTPDQIRVRRAILVLEQIGTPEAQRVLETLAGGAPEARQTRDAQAALRRLHIWLGKSRR